MALSRGDRLGPYEIVAPLGAGGMGEVWRARDERLGRDVAIKVLPASLAADPQRVRRVEKEARATGSLVHERGERPAQQHRPGAAPRLGGKRGLARPPAQLRGGTIDPATGELDGYAWSENVG